jgi:ATP-dependent DNA helicase RecG
MLEDNLETLLAGGEGPHLAFFRERCKIDDLAETLVAFANAGGGVALLGVAGRGRARVEGLADAAAARETALEAALVCTPPLVLPLPELRRHGDAALLLIQVPPGLPHVYSLHGKYLRRDGATNQPLLPDALRRLLADRGEVSWERLAPPGAALDDLDPNRVAAYMRRLGPAGGDDAFALLFRRGCLARAEGRGLGTEPNADAATLGPQSAALSPYVPTNAGLLLFAADVERHFPQCEITLVQYRGRDLADEFEREDVRDTLPEAIRRAERWLNEHMRKGSRMVGLEREDWVQFPTAAVREALVNAAAHRDYSVRGEGIRIALFADRLECYSPGRLPGHVTLANIVQERFSRNETLVQVLADLGLIERLGYGIDRMLRQMEAAGLPPPEFRETAAGFRVTLSGHELPPDAEGGVDTRQWAALGLNERQIAALLHLGQHQRITNREMQDLAPDVSAETLRRDLSDLVERGMLLKVGEKRATYYILK